jgi:hypothetical protein
MTRERPHSSTSDINGTKMNFLFNIAGTHSETKGYLFLFLTTSLTNRMLFEVASSILGLVDHAFSFLRILGGPARPKFFSKGWGDLAVPLKVQTSFLDQLLAEKNEKIPTVFQLKNDQITWGKITEESSITIQRASFASPVADYLPEESKDCRFFMVRPTKNKQLNNDVYVVLLPATGETGKSTRLNMARFYAKEYGWSSIIITAPFYAARKPSQQELFLINTVSDLLLQSMAITQEAACLICYYLQQSSRTKVCVTGFSWGGAMASTSTAAALLGGADGRRIACVPYVGSASPVCLADGILESSIDWKALKENKDIPDYQVRHQLFGEFNKAQLSVITDYLKPLGKERSTSVAVMRIVAMWDDYFIRRRHVDSFLVQLRDLSLDGCQMTVRWLPGGHVLAALLRPYFHRNAVADAMHTLQKAE